MMLRSLLPILLSLLLPPPTLAASPPAPHVDKPCTLRSPTTGSFYDLRPLSVSAPPPNSKSTPKESGPESWHAKGYDYPANFTLNICASVIEPFPDDGVDGITERRWQNVSAFYTTAKGEAFSIGQSSAAPIFRGKKLVLNYTDGSPCPDPPIHPRRKILDGDDDDDDNDDSSKPKPKKPVNTPPASSKSPTRYKSTLLSFLCDRDPSLTSHPAISFIGTPDSCSYFFEVRSRYACGGATSSSDSGTLGPGGVFGVIFGIALLAYLLGGCAYQRTVMHQRGWRQCPNYSVWAGIYSFVSVSGIALFTFHLGLCGLRAWLRDILPSIAFILRYASANDVHMARCMCLLCSANGQMHTYPLCPLIPSPCTYTSHQVRPPQFCIKLIPVHDRICSQFSSLPVHAECRV
jgi:cation-dependent mannose-6-phosphate receptor